MSNHQEKISIYFKRNSLIVILGGVIIVVLLILILLVLLLLSSIGSASDGNTVSPPQQNSSQPYIASPTNGEIIRVVEQWMTEVQRTNRNRYEIQILGMTACRVLPAEEAIGVTSKWNIGIDLSPHFLGAKAFVMKLERGTWVYGNLIEMMQGCR